jgi:hypothetical protein
MPQNCYNSHMPISRTIVCLANSRKTSGRCIAGSDPQGGAWVRPISAREHGEVSEWERQYQDGTDPQVLEVIDIPLNEPRPTSYQSENWLLDPEQYWQRRGRIEWGDLAALQSEPSALWLDGTPSTIAGENDRVSEENATTFSDSLRLIWVDNLSLRVFAPGADWGNSKRKVLGEFTYLGIPYAFWVTDAVVEREYLSRDNGVYELSDCFLTISLGEQFQGYCYKMIAAVIDQNR